jgi:hypothetical protein
MLPIFMHSLSPFALGFNLIFDLMNVCCISAGMIVKNNSKEKEKEDKNTDLPKVLLIYFL